MYSYGESTRFSYLAKMNLAPAMSKTKPKARLMPVLENLEIPKRVPMKAPNKTASKKIGSTLGSDLVDWKLPSRPAMEFTKIKAATVPLACLTLTQPNNEWRQEDSPTRAGNSREKANCNPNTHS